MQISRRLAAGLLAAIALATTAAPGASAELRPLPDCRYDDDLTKYRAYADWRRTLLDPIYMVPRSYAPPDLVSTADAGLNGGYLVRSVVRDRLRAMATAARNAGAPLAVQSAYRSYATQESAFAAEVRRVGYGRAVKQSARPGHSEHQLGTTIDFRSYGNTTPAWNYTDWGTTKAGTWLKANAWRYGFVMSYPKGKTTVTCYIYEPWHYRYVGPWRAKEIRDRGLTLREYLWYWDGNGY